MSEHPDRLPATCPSCSSAVETDHEVLSGGGSLTVRCSECGHVHKVQYERTAVVPLDVVVSHEGESETATVEVPADEDVTVGEEFVLESDDLLATVRVTSVELSGDRRVEEASAEDIETVWTRAVDNVAVDVTIHPGDGPLAESTSVTYYLPGDYELTVGDVEEVGKDEIRIDAIAVRRDVPGYDRERYERGGDTVLAKDTERVYAYDQRETTQRGW